MPDPTSDTSCYKTLISGSDWVTDVQDDFAWYRLKGLIAKLNVDYTAILLATLANAVPNIFTMPNLSSFAH
jgi:hypothetical protein